MVKEYASVINHKQLGNIHVKWNDNNLVIVAININEIFQNTEYVPHNFIKIHFPKLYEYLVCFGEKDIDFPVKYLDFSDIPPFYKTVYQKLMTVRKGQTVTYSNLAKMAGNPRACRAVGNAMNKNRYLLAVPCHRVVGKGHLGNFSKGIELKKKLLNLEGFSDLQL